MQDIILHVTLDKRLVIVSGRSLVKDHLLKDSIFEKKSRVNIIKG